MKKLDLRKDLKYLFSPSSKEVEVIRVPKFKYLMIDGSGDPNDSQEFADAVQALYTASYTLKFMIKQKKLVDYPVLALEGLWWTEDAGVFNMQQRADWRWTLMIQQPKLVTEPLFRSAVKHALEKKGLAALGRLRLESFEEGLAVQITHVGPYSTEAATVQKLHSSAKDRGLELAGKHHEIYLSDPRRTKPEKMKTVIRQPVRKLTAEPN